MTARTALTAIVSLTLVSGAVAQPATAPPAAAEAARTLGSFLDREAFLAVRFDVAGVDPNATWKTIQDLLSTQEDQSVRNEKMPSGLQFLGRWRQAFLEAGGQDMLLVLSMDDIPPGVPLFVATVRPGKSPEALRQMLHDTIPAGTTRHGPAGTEGTWEVCGNVVIGGLEPTLRRARGAATRAAEPTTQAAQRQRDLADGLAAVEGLPVQAVLLPTADQRRVVEATLPVFPLEPDGAPTKPFTRGVRWLALGLQTAPAPHLRAAAQSTDTAAAAEVKEAYVKLLRAVADEPELVRLIPRFNQLIAPLTPTVQGNRVVLDLAPPRFQRLLQQFLPETLAIVRGQVRMAISMDQLQQIYQGCAAYRADHRDEMPTNLQALVAGGYITEDVLISPITGRRYAYIPLPFTGPAAASSDPGTTIVAYEDPGKELTEAPLLYGDGHVSLEPVDAAFWRAVEESRRLAASATTQRAPATGPAGSP